jgi:hypothetical protein
VYENTDIPIRDGAPFFQGMKHLSYMPIRDGAPFFQGMKNLSYMVATY